jgi:hypothetical protein
MLTEPDMQHVTPVPYVFGQFGHGEHVGADVVVDPVSNGRVDVLVVVATLRL